MSCRPPILQPLQVPVGVISSQQMSPDSVLPTTVDVVNPPHPTEVTVSTRSTSLSNEEPGPSGSLPLSDDASTPCLPPSDMEERSRKRKRNTQGWKRNVRQLSRANGKEYVSRKGKLVAGKKPCGGCEEGCRFKCGVMISEDKQVQLCNEYYSLQDIQCKSQFLCSAVTEVAVRRRSIDAATGEAVSTKRKKSREYYLMSDDDRMRVCRNFFCSTLAISIKIVNRALKGKSDTGLFVGKDGRKGKVPANKTSDENIQKIVDHINSFPQVESHYTRKDSRKRYLAPDLNIQQLYRLYSEDYCQRLGLAPVKQEIYRRVFNTQFNLGFFIPKKDQCSTCNSYRNAVDTEKTNLHDAWEAHKRREKESMEEKSRDKVKACSDQSYRAITFDLEAVLSTPHAGDSQIYYRRKLAVYNFTILESASQQGFNYIWDETEGGRGANDIGSALLDYLRKLPATVTHVTSFSDTCGGQNRNQFICAVMLYAIRTLPSLQTVDLKYMESGHSYLDVDLMHSLIERATKHLKIYTTRDWEVAIAGARKKAPPFIVQRMMHTDFSDLKMLASTLLLNRSKNMEGDTVNWLRVKWLRFSKLHPFVIEYKYQISDENFLRLNISSKRGRPNTLIGDLTPAYLSRIPISTAKKADLLALLKSRVIPAEHAVFYNDLPSNARARDCLSEPCADEEED